MTLKAAIVGCGYVADFYMATACNHDAFEIAGAYDRDSGRLAAFCGHHGLRSYCSFEEMLADDEILLILNLTNPGSHFEVSERALLAGKHVYSEKPLTLRLDDAERLAELASDKGLTLWCAPSSMLGGAAQNLVQLLREDAIGRPRLIYANLEAGPVHLEGYRDWRSLSGATWPAEDEFSVGCTLEHAAYYLTWLCHIFGPVRRASAWSSLQIEDKGTGQTGTELAPDFSCACLEFADGIVARLTCGLLAPLDLSLQIFGERGSILVEDAWNYRSRVIVRDKRGHPLRELQVEDSSTFGPWPSQMDFARGPATQARAIASGTHSGTAAMLVHVTEVSLAIATAGSGLAFEPRTSFGARDVSEHARVGDPIA